MARRTITRRGLAALGAGALATAALVRRARAPVSGPHDTYFSALNQAVRDLGVPTLVLDAGRVQENARVITQALGKLPLRLVVKSLPCLPLLDLLQARRFMVFNPAMLAALWERDGAADILLGKPLPIAAIRALAAEHPEAFAAATGTQWLVDTTDRIAELGALGVPLKVSLELDIGLHRGGFTDLGPALAALKQQPSLQLAGLMGYEVHVGKAPAPLRGRLWDAALAKYQAAIDAVKAAGFDPASLTLNSGGSLTFRRHAQLGTCANDISVGSAFVMPSDFEQEGLLPAAFIAAPVVKRLERVELPALEWLGGVRGLLMPESARGVFVFGGNWLASPISPPGLSFNDTFGRSSNQELLVGSEQLALGPGDCVFYWPTQSEAVLNAFGALAVVNAGRLERWPVLV